MQNQQQKREQLLNLIKEEFLLKKNTLNEQNYSQGINLGAGVINKVMQEGLPIYQDELKQILYDQAKDNVSKVIEQIAKEHRLKDIQTKQDKVQSQNQPKRQRTKSQIKIAQVSQIPQLQQPSLSEPMQSFQQNIVTLFYNFTQLVASQVTINVQSNLNQILNKRKSKKRSQSTRPNIILKPSVLKVHLQDTKQTVKNVLIDSSRPDTPNFDLQKNTQKTLYPPQYQQQQNSVEEVYEEDFFDESVQDRNAAPILNRLQISKVSKVSNESEYIDDFEDNSGTNFQQQKSNFYNPPKNISQQNKARFEDSAKLDFSEDIEDLLM